MCVPLEDVVRRCACGSNFIAATRHQYNMGVCSVCYRGWKQAKRIEEEAAIRTRRFERPSDGDDKTPKVRIVAIAPDPDSREALDRYLELERQGQIIDMSVMNRLFEVVAATAVTIKEKVAA